MAGLRQAGCLKTGSLRVPTSTSVLALRILQLQHLKVNFGLGRFSWFWCCCFLLDCLSKSSPHGRHPTYVDLAG